jgi:hypothetical protein
LKRFLFINLGEVKEKRFQLFEPEEQILESPGTSLRFIKKFSEPAKNDLGNNPQIPDPRGTGFDLILGRVRFT